MNSSIDKDVLRIDQEDRHETLHLIPWWDQQKLSHAKILVVGAGALGNEAIKNLVLLGVGHIGIIDMDRIETSNLSRSIFFRKHDRGRTKVEVVTERAGELDPDVNLSPIVGNVLYDLGMEWFAEADVVLGCLDNREARLWLNRCCWHTGTPWIDAGIQEISGVVQVFCPPSGTCYECGMKEADYRLINRRYSCPLLSEEDLQKGRVPTTPTIGSMIAGWQVQEAIKLLHQLPTAESSAIVVHGLTNHVYRTALPRREACLSHDPWTPTYKFSGLNHHCTVGQIFGRLHDEFGQTPHALRLTREIVTAFQCPQCQEVQAYIQLRGRTSNQDALCPKCSASRIPHLLHRVGAEEFPLHEFTLKQLGIPPADWLPIDFAEGTLYVRLDDPVFPARSIEPEKTPGLPTSPTAPRKAQRDRGEIP